MNAATNAVETQITEGPGGRILTNTGVWSPDGNWIVYDTRSDPAGEQFDGLRIEMINVRTRELKVLHEAMDGAQCGVATFHPSELKVAFILGPTHPTADWSYGPSHRQGVIVSGDGRRENLDARDLTPPFTPGALRGGSHVHVWDPRGDWMSFTYNDALHEAETRDVAVAIPGPPVTVKRDHPRNHGGTYLSAVVTRTTPNPRPGSDEINRACEEGWVGTNGYLRADQTRQSRALAFQGWVVTERGTTVPEVFIVDLPASISGKEALLAGSTTQRPAPPATVQQRRLTFTTGRAFPGLQGPRHWLRSSPDGSQIAFLMKDDSGIVQIWTVSPLGGKPRQVTANAHAIASSFTWNAGGTHLAHIMDGSVCLTEVATGRTVRLTSRSTGEETPRPEACVFSPDGKAIAFVRRIRAGGASHNQICVVRVP